DIVTVGQYLRPSPKHASVDRYVPPETFAAFEKKALNLGFEYAACGPLVRSSYKAAEVFVRSMLRPGAPTGTERVLTERLARASSEAARVAGDGTPLSRGELLAKGAVSLLLDGPESRLVPASSLLKRSG